jgi:DNA topoisomerase-1
MVSATIKLLIQQTVSSRGSIKTVFKLTSRLCHSCDRRPGIRRERTKTGFRYRRPDGSLVHDAETLARIRTLAIPPAWEDVWICLNPNGHIQATGRDARNRKQYRYHPAFRLSKEEAKFTHLSAFGAALPRIRARVEADLARPGLPREKVLAAVVKLLDQTHLRVGKAVYAKKNHSYGLSTLQDRHVSFMRNAFRMRFRGKSGVWHERIVTDRKLVRVVRDCQHLPGQELFQFRDAVGRLHRVDSHDVNDYIRGAANGAFSAKDFRTWAGTVSALARLTGQPTPPSQTAAKKVVVRIIEEVAAELGNTRAVCKKSYIHPVVFDAFIGGRIPQSRKRTGLSTEESRTLELLGTGLTLASPGENATETAARSRS